MARVGSNGHVRGTVLVVEDEHTIADMVARYLTRAGYATRVAHDGPEALAAVAAQRPDLMVLDVMLPGLDGLEVMRRVRQQDRDGTAFILLTAKGEVSPTRATRSRERSACSQRRPPKCWQHNASTAST